MAPERRRPCFVTQRSGLGHSRPSRTSNRSRPKSVPGCGLGWNIGLPGDLAPRRAPGAHTHPFDREPDDPEHNEGGRLRATGNVHKWTSLGGEAAPPTPPVHGCNETIEAAAWQGGRAILKSTASTPISGQEDRRASPALAVARRPRHRPIGKVACASTPTPTSGRRSCRCHSRLSLSAAPPEPSFTSTSTMGNGQSIPAPVALQAPGLCVFGRSEIVAPEAITLVMKENMWNLSGNTVRDRDEGRWARPRQRGKGGGGARVTGVPNDTPGLKRASLTSTRPLPFLSSPAAE
eukprot:364308-Chlamydomonas_euryale.AAC.13